MKKFTSLMLMLLFTVATWAQVVEGQMYRLKEVSVSNAYLTIQGYNGAGETGAKGTVPFLEKSVANNDQVWFFEKTATEGQYYLKSKSEYYIVHGGWNVNAYNTESATKGIVELVDNGDETYKLKNINAGTWYKSEIPNGGGEYKYPYCDAAEGAACNWVLELVDESEFSATVVTVTYDFKDNNGVTRFTQDADVVDGAEYPAITIANKFPYGVTATAPVGNVNAEDAIDGVITVNVPLTVEELPFVAAETVEGINNWYYMQMHWNNKHYVAANGTAIEWKETAVPEENKDAYTWGFVGNIFDGFKVVNYAAYNEEGNDNTTLTWNSGTSLAAFDAATQFPLVHTGWSTASAESFCLAIPNTANYLNAQGTTIASWSDADAGSTFTLTERPMTLNAELEALIAEYEAISFPVGANPGEYTEAVVAEFNAAIATAKAVAAATQNDIDALVAAYEAVTMNPVVAGTYMIVSAASAFGENTKAISCYTYDTYYSAHRTPAWAPINENDPLQYWTLEDAGEGKFNIKAAYEGNYITTATSMSATAAAASFESLGSAQFRIILGGQFHCNGWNWGGAGVSGPLTTWDGVKDSPSAWKLVKVEAPSFTHTLTVSDAGYATLMLAFNATIPTGVECYYATHTEGDVLKLAAVEGTLPAKTPVIVKAAAGEYAFASTDATATVDGNILKGTLYPTNV
ncbi:MAG: hypothetical protein IJ277_06555, partial [Bacteroidaceae bacterium]|nr:hypothetical protein [Bacteroidaceae bacterium]